MKRISYKLAQQAEHLGGKPPGYAEAAKAAASSIYGDILELAEEAYATLREVYKDSTDAEAMKRLQQQSGNCRGCGQSHPDDPS